MIDNYFYLQAVENPLCIFIETVEVPFFIIRYYFQYTNSFS
jgi:hypothetical protein